MQVFSGLRGRLLLLVLLAVLPALGLILYTAHQSGRLAARQTVDEAKLLVRLAASDYERLVANTRQLLGTLAHLPDVHGRDAAGCNTLFAQLKPGYSQYANLGAIGPDGRVFCSAVPAAHRVDAADRSYFQRALKTRGFAVGDFQVGRITGQTVVVFAHPDYDAAGQLRVVVFAALNLGWLNQIAAKAQLPAGSTVTLLDSQGAILSRHPDPEKWIGKSKMHLPLTRAILASRGEDTAEATGLDGVPRLYAFAPLFESAPGAGVYLGVGIPRETAFAGVTRVFSQTVAGLALVTLLVLAAAWFGGDYFLLRQMRALAAAARRFGSGDLDARTGLAHERGEIGQLAGAFDEMAATLHARNTAFERVMQALGDSEERFRTLVETISDWIWEVDARGVYTYASPKVRELLGYAPEEVVGKTPFDFMPPDEAAKVGRRFAEIAAAQRPFERLENVNLHRDGRRVVLETSGVPIFDHEGRLAGWRGVDRDITARKQAEEALSESEAKLRTVSESAQDAILLIDDRGKITFWNRAAETMFGYGRDEALGRDIAELIIPARLREAHNRGLEAFQRTGEGPAIGKVLELPSLRRDGTEFIAEHSISAVKLKGKWHAVGVARDITARKQAEEALRTSEARLKLQIECMPIANIVWDPQFRVVSWNPAAERIFGFREAEVRGKHPYDLIVPKEVQPHVDRLWDRLLRGDETAHSVNENLTKDGRRIFCEWTNTALKQADGNIVGVLSMAQDMTERKQAEERLRFLAYHDELTALPNRALLLDRLTQALIDAARHERLAAVMYLDLRNFKNVNDTLGHQTGDQVIQTTAARLTACMRPGDTVARLGGDKFGVVLADVAQPDDVTHVMQKIRECFEQPLQAAGQELRLAIVLGISLYPPDGTDAETLLENADIAMYRARERGDDYQYYSAEMTASAAERLTLENDLRHALERGEFLLHYQPQVSLASGGVTGVEALVRWQHPRLGLVPPLKFIPLAEETGLIVPLGEWVLRQACTQARAWHEAGLAALRVAVNLSARQFRQPDLDQTVGRVLTETGLDPRHLELELTESILIQEPEAVADMLTRLARLGVQISIDDFGTGYSSLSYLKRLPIDMLKIDQGFMRDCTTDPDDAAIVQAIITMAHALGIQTLAEGVETKEQLAFLRQNACDAMQGFFFCRPVPAEEITRLLREHRRLDF